MKFIITNSILLFVLCIFSANAQNVSSLLKETYNDSINNIDSINYPIPVIDVDSIYKEVLEQEHADIERSLSKKPIEYATAHINLAQSYSDLGYYQEAVRICNEAIDIFKKTIGKEHPDYANALDNLARYYSALGNYQEAVRIGTEAIDLLEKTIGKEHPDYASALNCLALCYEALGNYQEAVRIGNKAIAILEKTIGKEHPDYASALNNLARYYSWLGNYQEAVRIRIEAIDIFKKTIGKEHPDYANALNCLALCYEALGNYQEAVRIGTEAIDLLEKTIGNEHPDYASALDRLAMYYAILGNYQKAIRICNVAIDILEKSRGNEHPDYASALDRLAMYYANLGNYQKAVRICNVAIDIFKKTIGKEHPDYAIALNNLAMYYASLGNYQEAVRICNEAIDISEKTIGNEYPDYARALNNLATCYAYLGNYQEAIRICNEAIDIIEKKQGKKNLNYVKALDNLAMCNLRLGYYQEAIIIGTEAISLVETILGKKHPNYTMCLSHLADFYDKVGENIKLLDKIINNMPTLKDIITTNFLFLPRNERQLYWHKTKRWFENILPCYAYRCNEDNFSSISLDGLLFSKGILLRSETSFDSFITDNSSINLLNKYNKIKSIRLQLNRLYEMPYSERFADTDSLEQCANELERQLMHESAEYGDYTRSLSVTWQDVRDNLKESDAAIEFESFQLNNDSTIYMAYVMRKDMETPKLVKLFEGKDMTKLITDDPHKIYSNKKVSKMLWKKIAPYLTHVKNVYFAPDGILHQIAIEYFPDFENDGLISDRYNIHRLSSTIEIALNKKRKISKDAVIYGGIKYDTDVKIMETESAKYDLYSSRGFTPFHSIVDSLSLRATRVTYLPFTMKEVEIIDSLMKMTNYNRLLISGDEGTEESFKSQSSMHNSIMHISTHGFYWKKDEAENKANLNNQLLFMSEFGNNSHRNIEDKALTRTGLLMAGANNTLSGKDIPENVDDGILTAKEIADLDFRDLDLVVLSACQTGMGDISSDGVFGLQRGFKKAGANSILMSLWNVDDEATQILMTEFYRNYLSGKSKQGSLKLAQQSLRNNPDYSAPEYWAGFILLDGLN